MSLRSNKDREAMNRLFDSLSLLASCAPIEEMKQELAAAGIDYEKETACISAITQRGTTPARASILSIRLPVKIVVEHCLRSSPAAVGGRKKLKLGPCQAFPNHGILAFSLQS